MEHPLVTVIIPTFGGKGDLKRAIDSAIGQTYSSIEIIIVDDNDSRSEFKAKNLSLMSNYSDDPRIIFLSHNRNCNASAARNTGIKHAKGQFIAFLDDDDYFFPEKIEKQVRALENLDESWGGVYCRVCIIGQDRQLAPISYNKRGDLHLDVISMEAKIFGGSTLLLSSSVIREMGGFDEKFQRHQDYEFLVRFFRNKLLEVVDEVLVAVDRTAPNKSFNPESLLLLKEQFLKEFANDISLYPLKVRRKIYYNHYVEVCKAYIGNGQYVEGAKIIKKISKFSLGFLTDISLCVALLDSLFPDKQIRYHLNIAMMK